MADSPDAAPPAGPFGPGTPERFVWSRRYAAGLGGVRGLLITVLGDYLRPTGSAAPTSAFIEVMSRLGVEETACRQALIRAAADGWLVTKRSGRFTWWQLSPAFEQFLAMGAERIFGFAASQPGWDRRWLVVVTRAAESNRAARHLVRTRLRWSGFGPLGPGVWISTHTDRAKDAEITLREARVFEDCQIFLSEYLTGGDPAVIVRQAWDLDDVEREYEAFLAEFTRQPSDDPLVRTTRLVHAWRRLALLDPALPTELLPAGWIGARAVKLFRRQHAKWLPQATQEWGRISRHAR
ncbi:PaaX family transcriptional regulator C-terminal domain-containing protein [Actinoplanes sp. ATCC 53533]|uniref:PaaX family transcriptional regulator n=1 Tax=Actinoplanes sp. ATCC 53533 TaxID=1288362 RepID=UPI00131504E0|nr:PaaX family transcriptional regulator C-terminal domain-containing protein [Actinoplanes sp. ATCC 53533]